MTAAVALPTPPFTVAPGLANLRDAGGYAVAPRPGEYPNGAMVKRGLLYRSADLTMVGQEAVDVLRKLKIQRVFDLRSIVEIGYNKPTGETIETVTKLPDDWAEAERVFVPVFLDQDYSAAAIATRFSNYSNGVEVSQSTHTHPSSSRSRVLQLLCYLSSLRKPTEAKRRRAAVWCNK